MTVVQRRATGALFLLLAGAPCAAADTDREAAEVGRRFAPVPVWVVGERHRVPAGHRLFGELVARSLSAGERVQVGLEIPVDRQRALDAALAGGSTAVAPVVIDCPSYRELLQRLGELGEGYPGRLQVSAIDAPTGARGDRDLHMAAALASAGPQPERVLVLVGNLHALKGKPPAPSGSGGRLAALLEAGGRQVASLLQLGAGAGPGAQSSGVLRASSPTARPALRRLAGLTAGPKPRDGSWLSHAADGVILRP
jgi:hypothetical protein